MVSLLDMLAVGAASEHARMVNCIIQRWIRHTRGFIFSITQRVLNYFPRWLQTINTSSLLFKAVMVRSWLEPILLSTSACQKLCLCRVAHFYLFPHFEPAILLSSFTSQSSNVALLTMRYLWSYEPLMTLYDFSFQYDIPYLPTFYPFQKL